MRRELMEWVDGALEGTLSEADFRSLSDEMRADVEVRRYWRRQAEMHGILEWEFSQGVKLMEGEMEVKRGKVGRRVAAAAAILFLGWGLGYGMRRSGDEGRVPSDGGLAAWKGEAVGRLTAVEGARWRGRELEVGDWVREGAIELESGEAELTFDCGASMQVRGPAEFHLLSPTRAMIESGEATVDIPRQAYGFVFETPSAEISRRQSRFVVVVEEGGHSEIHVLEGQIQLAGKRGDLKNLDLGKDGAVRVSGEGRVESGVRYQAGELALSLPESADLRPEWYLHWGFDSVNPSEGTFRETGRSREVAERYDAQVHLADAAAEILLVPGRFGNAVRFNGQMAFLATLYPGFEGNQPRTVAFWVKVEPESSESQSYSFLSWGTKNSKGGGKWQMGWNTGRDNAGVVGAIRTEVERGYHVGSTNLRSGRWHHVVCVFTGGEGANVMSDVRHYVDGRLEATTAVRSMEVSTFVSGEGALPLSFGRRLDADDPGSLFRTFRGEMDEVYLFPCALTPDQIEQLYLNNRPPELKR